nr:Dabb family protein [Paraburkholderia caribensis]
MNVLIRHIVMWKLQAGEGRTREQNALVLKEKLEACRDAVPGIVHLEVGIATPGLDSTYDVVLVSDFTSKAALDGYQIHPVHQDVKAFLAPIREARQAVDYEL